MTTNQNPNTGQTQINQTRNSFNDKVGKLNMLGKSRGIIWRNQLRNRSI